MPETRHSVDPGTPQSPLEQALKEAAERTELALAAANMGIWSLDAAKQTITFDDRSRAMWGLPVGASTCSVSEFEQMVHPDDRAVRHAERQKGLDPDGDGRFEVEFRIAAREGHLERWVAVRGQTTFSGGNAVRMIGTVRDITAPKTVEQRLRASEEKLSLRKSELEAEVVARTRQLEAMHEAAVNAILTIDPSGAVQSINAATTKLLGYAKDDLLGQNVRMIMPEPYAREHDGYLKSYLETGAKKIIGIGREVMARRKDGSTLPIHLAVSEFEANGKRYFTGIITDLSARKAAELALRETERQLAQAQKMEAVGQLTGGLAHDFNNLLTVITGNLELLDMRLENEVDRDLVRRAEEAARMGARLTGRLLTFSRRRALQPTVVNLNDTTVGLTELLRHSLGESVNVTSELAPDLWMTRVDAGEIENAILNLAINARDAMPSGGRILIETSNFTSTKDDSSLSPDTVPGDYVKLTVSDGGIGMAPDVVARAFEPFFTTKEAGRGTGLGLSTIYGFVKQSGGYANIYSEVGKGTAVSLYLPRDVDSATAEPRASSVPEISTGFGERVLVVEDNEQVRVLTVRRLEALGYQILVAENGSAAMAMLEQRTDIDLVFSDVVMPGGLSGFDVAAWIKRHRPNVRVLLTSGFAPEMAPGGAAVGSETQLLRKPYKQADLARAVRKALKA